MTTDTALLDTEARITELPGPARLARVGEVAWEWVRAVATGVAAPEPPVAAVEELERAGLLVPSATDPDGLELDEHWAAAVAAGERTPVRVDMVCVDGRRSWTSSLRIAGRIVLVVDRVRRLEVGEDSLRLGDRSSAVTLAVTTMSALSATVAALVPQRPAFTDAEPDPLPDGRADAPSLAQVQLVVGAVRDGRPVFRTGGAFHALGDRGEHLVVLRRDGVADTDAGGVLALPARPDTLVRTVELGVMAAVDALVATGARR